MALLILACGALVAGESWNDEFDAVTLDATWQIAGDEGAVVLERGRLAIRGPQQRTRFIRRDLAGADPDDAAPLVVSVRLDDDRRDGHPAALALGWGTGEAFAIIAGQGGDRRPQPTAAWIASSGAGAGQLQRLGSDLALDPAGGHYRVVVGARSVSAWASRDGLRFWRLAQVDRQPGRFAGAPRWLSLGRGWPATPGLVENPGDQRPALLTADALRVQRRPGDAGAPAPAGADADATLRAWLGDPLLRGWQVLGPLATTIRGGDLTLEPGRTWPLIEGAPAAWSAAPESEVGDAQVVEVGRLIGGKREDAVFAAGVRLRAATARDELLAFDGLREVEVHLNGWPVCGPHRSDRERLLPGRHEVMLHLRPGDNDLVVRLSGARARARLVATGSAGEPARRAAAAVAAASVEPGRRAALLAEAALCWEASGFSIRAAAAWEEVATAGDRRRAAQARARLLRQLGDGDGVLTAARELAAVVPAEERAEALGDLVATAVRAGDERALAIAALAGEVGAVESELLRAGLADARGEVDGRVAALLRAAALPGADAGPIALEAVEARLRPLRGQLAGAIDLAALRAVLPAAAAALAAFGAPARAAAAPALAAAGTASDSHAALVHITRASLAAAAAGDPATRTLHALAERAGLGVLRADGRDLNTIAASADHALAGLASSALQRRAAVWLAVWQACPDRPAQAADELVRCAGALVEADDRAHGLALVRLIAAVASDHPGVQVAAGATVASRLRGPEAWPLARTLVADAGRLIRRRPGDEAVQRRTELHATLPRLALALGDGAAARALWLALLARLQDDGEARLAGDFVEAERQAGELAGARALLDRLIAAPLREAAAREGWLLRRGDWAALRPEPVDLLLNDDGATVLDTAERAAADHDLDRAAALWQRAIVEHGRGLCRIDGNRVVSIGEFAASRLRVTASQEPALLASWQRQFAGEAATALARAGDDSARAAVARTWRFAPAAASALRTLAARARDDGRWTEAAWALERLLRDHGGGSAPLLVLAALADAQARSGDASAAATLADLARHGGDAQVIIAGRALPVAAFVQAQRRRGDSPASAAAAGARRLDIALPTRPGEETAAWSAWPQSVRLPSGRLVIADDALLIAGDDDLHALALADGALRWSTPRALALLAGRAPAPLATRTEKAERTVTARVDNRPALAEGRVFSRAARRGPGSGVIEARLLADGVLLWSSERDGATADLDVVSPPAATAGTVVALARQGDVGGRLVALAWDAASGRLRWRTALGAGNAELRLRETAYALGDALAAPLIVDGAVHVAGLGQVAALDLTDGAVRWLATYPRPPSDGLDHRWARLLAVRAPALAAGDELLYVLPRDAVALCALRRSDGREAWRRPWSCEHALIGVARGAAGGGGELLVMQGIAVTALRAADGATAWRWQPVAPLIGDVLLSGDSVIAGAGDGLWRLAAADGASRGVQPWTQLGGVPFGHLASAGGRLAGLGDPFSRLRAVVVPTGAGAVPAISIDLAASGQALLPAGSSPPATSGPVALRWRLPPSATGGGEIVRNQPEDGGEIYVRQGDALLRLDPAADRLDWRVRTTGDLRSLAVDGDALALIFPGRIEAWDRADGRRRWTFAPLDDAERPSLKRVSAVAAGELGGARVWAVGGDRLWFIDRADGRVRATTVLTGRAHAVAWTARGPLCVIEDGANLMLRGIAADGSLDWRLPVPIAGNSRRDAVVLVDGDTLYVAGGDQAARIDLAARTLTWGVRHESGGLGTWQPARVGTFLALVERGEFDEGRSVVLDAASGRIVTRQPGAWVIEPTRMVGPAPRGPNQPPAVLCLRLPDGQHLWRAVHSGDERQLFLGRWRGHWLHLVGRELVILREGGSRRLVGRMLDDATGAVIEEVEIPGTQGERRVRGWEARAGWAAVAGGTLLAVADQGVIAVAPGSGGAGTPVTTPMRLEAAVQATRGERASLAVTAWPAPQVAQAPDAAGWAQIPARRLESIDDLRTGAPATWNGPGDLAVSIAAAWDEERLHLHVTVDDDRVQPPPPGAPPSAGDSLVIALDPEGDFGDTFGMADGRRTSRDVLLHVVAQEGDQRPLALVGDAAGMECRVSRRPGGLVYDLAMPWRGQVVAAGARLGVGVVALDWDGANAKSMEWGAGLHDGLRPRRFARVQLAGLGAQHRDQHAAFVAAYPDQPLAYELARRLAPGAEAPSAQRATWFADLVRRFPTSRLAGPALAELAAQTNPDEAARHAHAAGVPAAMIGDALGPSAAPGASPGPGRALAQWCWIDPAQPPQGVSVRVRSRLGWVHGASWGVPPVEDGTATSARLGALPAPGAWVRLLLPVHRLGLAGQVVQELAFANVGGRVLWGPTEILAEGAMRTLIDGVLPAGAAFRGPGGWIDELPPGAPRPLARVHAGSGAHRIATTADLAAFPEPPPPPFDAVAAADLIADTEEAMVMLMAAEAALPADGRAEAASALHLGFLRRHPATPLAARLLQRVLIARGLPTTTSITYTLRLDDALPVTRSNVTDLLPLDVVLRRHATGWDWGSVRGESPRIARGNGRVGGRMHEGASENGTTIELDLGPDGGGRDEGTGRYVLAWRADGTRLDGTVSGRARGRDVSGRVSGRSEPRVLADLSAGPPPESADLARVLDVISAGQTLRRAFWRDAAPCLGPWKRIGHFDGDRGADNRSVPFGPEQGALDFNRGEPGLGGELRWQDVAHDGRDLRLTAEGRIADEADGWPVSYLATRFSIPGRRSARLILGWSNFAAVWLNGQRLACDEGNGEFDRERANLAVDLKAGRNELLIKLLPNRGNGRVHCRLAEEDGRPIAVGASD